MRAIQVLGLLFLLIPSTGICNPCGPAGSSNLFQQNDKAGYFIQRNVAKRSLLLVFLGQSIQIDNSAPNLTNAFKLDGIHYQSLMTSTDIFKNRNGTTSHAEILLKHAQWERDAAGKSPSPLTSFEDLGNRVRPASRSTPTLTFKLWRLFSPIRDDVSQYFLTTVVDEEVIVLSAIVPSIPNMRSQFLGVAEKYSSSFHYLRQEECQ